jgi:3-phenylpropionate/cinnamic acid dioxygenase small subunit
MSDDPAFVRRVEEYLFHEARLLDEREFEAWMALFADDGIYWIPATPGQQDPLGEVSIAYEDLQLIDVRVRRLRHPENYADQPQARTRRVIGNVMLDDSDAASTVVRSNFTLVEFQNDEQRLFAGEYIHTLRQVGDDFQIVQKRVNLLNCDAPMGAIVIPF